MTTNRKKVQSYLEKQDFEKLEENRKTEQLSKSKFIEKAIKKYLKEKEGKNKS